MSRWRRQQRRRAGRHPKPDPGAQRRNLKVKLIARMVRRGLSLELACAAHGVSVGAVRRWLRSECAWDIVYAQAVAEERALRYAVREFATTGKALIEGQMVSVTQHPDGTWLAEGSIADCVITGTVSV